MARRTVEGPGVDARPLPAWGLYARNVENLVVEDVRLSLAKEDLRPVVVAEKVEQLTFDGFRFPQGTNVTNSLVTNKVGNLILRQTDFK